MSERGVLGVAAASLVVFIVLAILMYNNEPLQKKSLCCCVAAQDQDSRPESVESELLVSPTDTPLPEDAVTVNVRPIYNGTW